MKRLAALFCLILVLLLAASQAMAQTTTVVLKAPTGVTQFIGPDGSVVTPDANGHVTALLTQEQYFAAAGFQEYTTYMLQQAAMNQMVFVISPATLTTGHGSAANRTVTVTLKNAAGEVHTWYNRAVTSGVSIAVAHTGGGTGTATIVSTTLTFVNGVATVVITEGGSPLATDTDTLTIPAETICGFSVTGVTSVETYS
jgi:hypothetical protein